MVLPAGISAAPRLKKMIAKPATRMPLARARLENLVSTQLAIKPFPFPRRQQRLLAIGS
jgi:hypothetical protein